MLDITIITVGELKEPFIKEGCDLYRQRLKPYARLRFQTVQPESFTPNNQSPAKKKEGEKLIKKLSKYSPDSVYLLTEMGKLFDSLQWADNVLRSDQPMIFVIGGPLGLDEQLLRIYPNKLSLSPLTFTHELAQLLLLEQIYRGISIGGGKKYHY
ncbi:MAG: 23S rRNA (pseudouridine(1915)-N(3))-methyltransferase RlmH [Candidatus Komeilibacteria bacterium]|nr:23S rRNA (pseudouridine(1915)-N(3))-methyltransferase RlmH [Candidatus Komeilibacteria bacterium]